MLDKSISIPGPVLPVSMGLTVASSPSHQPSTPNQSPDPIVSTSVISRAKFIFSVFWYCLNLDTHLTWSALS